MGPAPARASAAWGNPVRLSSPFSLDVISPALALSPSGTATVVFGVQDADNSADANAYAVSRSSSGAVSKPLLVPGDQQPMDVAFDGQTAVILGGASPAGESCCASAGVVRLAGARFRRGQTLVKSLSGEAIGRLVSLPGRMLAAIATPRGVWVSQSVQGGRFGAAHRVTATRAIPETLQAAALPKGGSVVAWTETKPASHGAGPASIFVATGSQRSVPDHSHPAVKLTGGRRVEELGLVTATGATTLAWTEGSFDRQGNYVSDVALSDLTGKRTVTRFAVRGTVASGLTLAGDDRGDQLLAWRTCTFGSDCAVRAAIRTAGHRFGSPARVDAIDASDAPVAALSSEGVGLLGWIHAGHVVAADLPRGATRLSRLHTVSRTRFAADLTIGFGARGNALAVWSQGTLAPEVVAAPYRP